MDMSDKNVQRRAQQQQWSKPVATTTTLTAPVINTALLGDSPGGDGDMKLKHLHAPYDLTGVLSTNISPYGIGLMGLPGSGSGATSDIMSHATHTNAGYARFQPPSIHSHLHVAGMSAVVAAAAAASSPDGTNLAHAPTTVASNVPVFVPPAYTAAPTSVLTPNPFAVSSSCGNGDNTVTPASFGIMEHQFPQHLSKIMSSVNSVATLTTNNTMANVIASGMGVQQISVPPRTQVLTTATLAAASTSATAVTAHSPQANRTTAVEMCAGGNNNAVASAITTTIAENVLSVICSSSNSNEGSATPVHGRFLGMGIKVPDEEKMVRIQSVIEAGISDHSKQQIVQILDRISTLKPVEKLLLYLRLPGEAPETDPLRHPQNPLGTRSEINHTINWVRTHLEHDPQVSIPKQDVYNDYIAYCERLEIKPLSTADFGKVMKQVFPGIRPRRLGTRGHSRYCYAAMRKTTKLTPPQLPHLGTTSIADTVASTDGGTSDAYVATTIPSSGTSAISMHTSTDSNAWVTVKTWAETLLNIKLENIDELATRINTNNALGLGLLPMSKKYTHQQQQREPKEKRLQVDMGPLKKRRKKKRKGSSSSESSSQCALPRGDSENVNNIKIVTALADPTLVSSITRDMQSQQFDQEQKPIKIMKIKQEKLDSPNFAHVQQLSTAMHMPTATLTSNSNTHTDRIPQQQQVLPMNLAPEQRTIMSNKVPIITSAAVKNLMPKIMEVAKNSNSNNSGSLASTTRIVKPITTPIILQPSQQSQTLSSTITTSTDSMPVIKEEIIDDYNPSNIICKKVRKAQQTKGFLTANSPIVTTTVNSPPVATTVISSTSIPPPPPPSVTTPVVVIVGDTPSITYSMGPPAQMITSAAAMSNSSNNPSTSTLMTAESSSGCGGISGVTPKVASRNLSQLRAKRFQMSLAAAAAAAEANANELAAAGSSSSGSGADKDADLPDNLGLPRERVISICNMDKHELDDYFLPGDEENSQDQDTELLQYFQTGDAEDKINSLDANKLRTPTVAQLATNVNNNNNNNSNGNNNNTIGIEGKAPNACVARQPTVAALATVTATMQNDVSNIAVSGLNATDKNATTAFVTTLTAAVTTTTTTVGPASASLALLSQKHQLQQEQHQQHEKIEQLQQHQLHSPHQQQQLPHQQQQIGINKRKISLDYSQRLAPARKNCIFMPITSPNINSSNNYHLNNMLNASIDGGGGGSRNTAYDIISNSSCFASPSTGVTRTRSKPPFSKQQSLDCEDSSSGSDPMIGANRRRRSYANFLPNSTSASAPPSPSVLHQQQREIFGTQTQFFGTPSSGGSNSISWALGIGGGVAGNANYNSQPSAALLGAEQNSLDLDLFAVSGGCNYTQNASLAIESGDSAMTSNVPLLNETQRSQSVPLSQLQRVHSPTFNRIGIGGGGGVSFQGVTTYSTCVSVAQTPVPPDFGENTLFSENSNSQQSIAGHNTSNNNNNSNQVNANAEVMKLDEGVVLASDSTAMLDDVDVSDILSSSDFVSKFSSIAQSSCGGATTTCSSSGSSSGYSSAGGSGSSGGTGGMSNIFSVGSLNANLSSNGVSCGGIISRSVPSTPLPHQNIYGCVGVYGRRRGNDEARVLSPTGLSSSARSMAMSFKAYTGSKYGLANGSGRNCGSVGVGCNNNAINTRSIYDISKSMPTTPITTPCFRYSPTEFQRDFLINGIDNITTFNNTSTTPASGNDNMLIGGRDSVSNAIGATSAGTNADIDVSIGEALIDGDCGVESEVFGGSDGGGGDNGGGCGSSDAGSIMVGADLLSNL